MDIAIAIFNIAAGLGVLAAGLALAYLAWQAAPLIRESRALTKDLRRLAHTADAELQPMLARARELATNVEVLSEDAAVKLERLDGALATLEAGLASDRLTVAAGHPEPRPVESWEMRQDGTDS